MRIPTRCLKVGDPELDIDCAVCIDPYQIGDVVRTLPCRATAINVLHFYCANVYHDMEDCLLGTLRNELLLNENIS
ncbi:unnamed protein product [Strongylus vulgaris]|uniref:RING-type domain-containing protein n=1 Tax=Strongylus vulgaris TaxID=40348 RepID=A0A3P7KD85_STRVU|nr:unnamed protein product [Strongylus vulgaris]